MLPAFRAISSFFTRFTCPRNASESSPPASRASRSALFTRPIFASILRIRPVSSPPSSISPRFFRTKRSAALPASVSPNFVFSFSSSCSCRALPLGAVFSLLSPATISLRSMLPLASRMIFSISSRERAELEPSSATIRPMSFIIWDSVQRKSILLMPRLKSSTLPMPSSARI
ncbi:MAG: hypothetical protein A4E70_02182 [Syntrophus sp. PtaU1.Bin005]|nr:MAG: hypothetical protein A4E70_02182 [Syntrophus sp. PtaU1.Bin005]